jgi:hypothetical protein
MTPNHCVPHSQPAACHRPAWRWLLAWDIPHKAAGLSAFISQSSCCPATLDRISTHDNSWHFMNAPCHRPNTTQTNPFLVATVTIPAHQVCWNVSVNVGKPCGPFGVPLPAAMAVATTALSLVKHTFPPGAFAVACRPPFTVRVALVLLARSVIVGGRFGVRPEQCVLHFVTAK